MFREQRGIPQANTLSFSSSLEGSTMINEHEQQELPAGANSTLRQDSAANCTAG